MTAALGTMAGLLLPWIFLLTLLLALAWGRPPVGLGQHSPATGPALLDWAIRKPGPDWTASNLFPQLMLVEVRFQHLTLHIFLQVFLLPAASNTCTHKIFC